MDITFSNSPPGGKSTNPKEDEVQQALWEFLAGVMIKGVPIQDYCYMVPNGTYLGSGSRQGKARYMAKLKSMGFKAGVSDIVIACPVPPYAGAYLELKRERGGTLSKAQKSWLRLMYGVGYYVSVCHGLEQATADVISYLHGEPIRSAVKKRLDI